MRRVLPQPLRADPRLLEARVREVAAARARLTSARCSAPRNWDSEALRADLLDALELLAAALTAAGASLPYRLHAEMALYRGLSPQASLKAR